VVNGTEPSHSIGVPARAYGEWLQPYGWLQGKLIEWKGSVQLISKVDCFVKKTNKIKIGKK